MASRLGRQTFSTATRTARSGRTRSNLHAPRRHMSADTHHEFKPKPDLPWIIGASVITLPTLAYLLKDTMAIKQKIAAGHHGHEEHGHEHSAEEGHPAHEEEDADASKDKDKDSDESKDAGATEEKSKSADSTSDAAVSDKEEEWKGSKVDVNKTSKQESTPSKKNPDGKEQKEKKGDTDDGEKEESK